MGKSKFQSRISEIEAAQKRKEAEALVKSLADAWGKPIVPRGQIKQFTGGLYEPSYFGNLDSTGEGVPGAFNLGRQKVYPTGNLCDWLVDRISV